MDGRACVVCNLRYRPANCTYMWIFIRDIYVCNCICIFICVCICVYMRGVPNIFPCEYMHVYVYLYETSKYVYVCVCLYIHIFTYMYNLLDDISSYNLITWGIVRGGGLGSRPKKMYGERLGDGVEYHSMKPTPRRRYIKLQLDNLREVGGWGRDPFSRNFMKPTPRRKWYLTTGRRFHWMVLDPIP